MRAQILRYCHTEIISHVHMCMEHILNVVVAQRLAVGLPVHQD